MERGVTESHLVICVCSDKYIEKADGGLAGAGYEKRILTSEMLNDGDKRFVIPIIKDCSHVRKVPLFLSGLKRSEEHTSELQSRQYLVCRLLLEKKKQT